METTIRTAGVEITETTAREVATTVTTTMEEATTAIIKVPIVRMDTARYVLSVTDNQNWSSVGAFIQYVCKSFLCSIKSYNQGYNQDYNQSNYNQGNYNQGSYNYSNYRQYPGYGQGYSDGYNQQQSYNQQYQQVRPNIICL